MDTPLNLRDCTKIFRGFALGAVLLAGLFVSGCGKVQFSEDPALQLEFSADTILFDTVFTTIGSVTLPLKVYNRNTEAVRIDEIELVGGSESPFRVNIDGEVGPTDVDRSLMATVGNLTQGGGRYGAGWGYAVALTKLDKEVAEKKTLITLKVN